MDTIDLEVREGLAKVTLNRPDSGNAMNLQFGRDIQAIAQQCKLDESVRAILLTGNGRMFCAGGDLAEFGHSDDLPALIAELLSHLHDAVDILTAIRAPVVVAVNGTAAGAVLSLAAAGDLVLAASSAKFTAAYTGAGLSPDGSMTYFLPRLVGLRRTQELMITNRVLSAEEACEWGIVTKVVADEVLRDEAETLARQLADGPTSAFGSVKKLLRSSAEFDLARQLDAEAMEICANAGRADGGEGIAAFLEKRKPAFTGR